jgi:protein phosphatase PTC7
LYYSLEVEPRDLLILGSDGLWDNLFDWEILNLLGNNSTTSPSGIAEIIGQQAYFNSKAETAGPFQEAVHQAYPEAQWRGGKVDDITVLTARIMQLESN